MSWTHDQVLSTKAGKRTAAANSGKLPDTNPKPSVIPPQCPPQAVSVFDAIGMHPLPGNTANGQPFKEFDFNCEYWKALEKSGCPRSVTVSINIVPCPAPRMTQKDKWLKPRRPCVARYFAYRDVLKSAIRNIPGVPDEVICHFWFPMPKSWSEKKKTSMDGKPHKQRPDRDNCDKSICDSLFEEDGAIWRGRQEKRWCYEGKERVMLTFVFDAII